MVDTRSAAQGQERVVLIAARREWIPELSDENCEEQVRDFLQEHGFTVLTAQVTTRG